MEHEAFSKACHLKWRGTRNHWLLMGKAKGKKQFSISRHRQDDTKIGFKQMG